MKQQTAPGHARMNEERVKDYVQTDGGLALYTPEEAEAIDRAAMRAFREYDGPKRQPRKKQEAA